MATMVGFIVLVACSLHAGPYLTRRDIYFGVTVAPGFRDGPVARLVSRRYATQVWLHALVAAVLVVSSRAPLLAEPVVLGQLFGASVVFAQARDALVPYAAPPATLREAELARRPSLPGGLAGQLGPFVILLIAAVYVGLNWDRVPLRFPDHWNIAGRPDGWTHKSIVGVYEGLWLGLVMCAAMLASSYGVLHGTRLARVTGEGGRRSRSVRRVNLLAMLATEYVLASLLAWTHIAPALADSADRLRLPLALFVAPFVIAIVGTVAVAWARQGDGSADTSRPPVGDTTPDTCWKWGQLYYNPADPAVFVEKRFGVGYTLNFGNRLSWLAVILTIVALLVPMMLGG